MNEEVKREMLAYHKQEVARLEGEGFEDFENGELIEHLAPSGAWVPAVFIGCAIQLGKNPPATQEVIEVEPSLIRKIPPTTTIVINGKEYTTTPEKAAEVEALLGEENHEG